MISLYLFIASLLGISYIFLRRRRLVHEGAAVAKLSRRRVVEKEVARTEHVMTGSFSLEEKTRRLRDVIAQVTRFTRSAETAFARQDFKDTEKLLVQALSLDEFNPAANRLLGLTYLHTGQWAKAEAIFQRLTELEKDDASHFGNLGLALYYLERYDDAAGAYEAALIRDDKKASRFVSLGQVELRRGRNEAAAKAFEKALEREPKNIEYHFALADAYRALGNLDAEKVVYAHVLDLSPYNDEAKSRLNAITVAENT